MRSPIRCFTKEIKGFAFKKLIFSCVSTKIMQNPRYRRFRKLRFPRERCTEKLWGIKYTCVNNKQHLFSHTSTLLFIQPLLPSPPYRIRWLVRSPNYWIIAVIPNTTFQQCGPRTCNCFIVQQKNEY